MLAGDGPAARDALAALRARAAAVPVGLYTVRVPERPPGPGTSRGVGRAVRAMGPVLATAADVPAGGVCTSRTPIARGERTSRLPMQRGAGPVERSAAGAVRGARAPCATRAPAGTDPRTEEGDVPAKETHGIR